MESKSTIHKRLLNKNAKRSTPFKTNKATGSESKNPTENHFPRFWHALPEGRKTEGIRIGWKFKLLSFISFLVFLAIVLLCYPHFPGCNKVFFIKISIGDLLHRFFHSPLIKSDLVFTYISYLFIFLSSCPVNNCSED